MIKQINEKALVNVLKNHIGTFFSKRSTVGQFWSNLINQSDTTTAPIMLYVDGDNKRSNPIGLEVYTTFGRSGGYIHAQKGYMDIKIVSQLIANGIVKFKTRVAAGLKTLDSRQDVLIYIINEFIGEPVEIFMQMGKTDIETTLTFGEYKNKLLTEFISESGNVLGAILLIFAKLLTLNPHLTPSTISSAYGIIAIKGFGGNQKLANFLKEHLPNVQIFME